MKRILVNFLIAATVGSFLIVGSAFGDPMRYSEGQVQKIFKKAFMYKHIDSDKKFVKDDASEAFSSYIPKASSSDQSSKTLAKLQDFSGECYTCDSSNWVGNGDDNNPSENPPVPEPATMLLVGTGLVGLVGFARRKTRKK